MSNQPLQEYPYLFSNGKFKVNTDYSINHTIIGMMWPKTFWLEDVEEDEVFVEEVDRCTLIARPIDDMSGKEIVEFEGSLINVDRNTALKVISNTDRLKTWGMINLLSIGVYPFDQLHFEDGTVIDATTI